MGHRLIALVACLLACQRAAAAAALALQGVAEGFYWSQADAVNQRFGSLAPWQRLAALRLVAAPSLRSYLFAPQADTLAAFSPGAAQHWAQAAQLAAALGLELVYCLRPGYLDDNDSDNGVAAAGAAAMATAGAAVPSCNVAPARVAVCKGASTLRSSSRRSSSRSSSRRHGSPSRGSRRLKATPRVMSRAVVARADPRQADPTADTEE